MLARLRGVVRVAHVHDLHDLDSYLLVPAEWNLRAELSRAIDSRAAAVMGTTGPLLDRIVVELAAILMETVESDVALWLRSAGAEEPGSQSLHERLTGGTAALSKLCGTSSRRYFATSWSPNPAYTCRTARAPRAECLRVLSIAFGAPRP